MTNLTVKPTKQRSLKWKEHYIGWLYCSPIIIGVLVFTLVPIMLSVYSMFLNWTGYKSIFSAPSAGLDNFKQVFIGLYSENFYKAIINTFFMMLNIPITLFLGVILGIGMNRQMMGAKTFRVLYYLPSITSVVAVTILFQKLFDFDGTINIALGALGLEKQDWLKNDIMVKITVNILLLWKGVGYTSLMYLAGLQSVSKEQLEASSIDGAGKAKQFFKITLPALYPITFFLLVTSVMNGLQLFSEPFILVGYGTGNNAMTLGSFVYYYYNKNKLGVAGVGAWALAFLVFIVTAIQLYFDNKKEKY